MKMPCRITDEKVIPEPQAPYPFDLAWKATELVQTRDYWLGYGLPFGVAHEMAELMKAVESRRTGGDPQDVIDRAVLLMGEAVDDEVENG